MSSKVSWWHFTWWASFALCGDPHFAWYMPRSFWQNWPAFYVFRSRKIDSILSAGCFYSCSFQKSHLPRTVYNWINNNWFGRTQGTIRFALRKLGAWQKHLKRFGFQRDSISNHSHIAGYSFLSLNWCDERKGKFHSFKCHKERRTASLCTHPIFLTTTS